MSVYAPEIWVSLYSIIHKVEPNVRAITKDTCFEDFTESARGDSTPRSELPASYPASLCRCAFFHLSLSNQGIAASVAFPFSEGCRSAFLVQTEECCLW